MIRIQENVQLKTLNTFGIRANARHFVSLQRPMICLSFSKPICLRTNRG
jgi:hypothetical protein